MYKTRCRRKATGVPRPTRVEGGSASKVLSRCTERVEPVPCNRNGLDVALSLHSSPLEDGLP